MIRYENYSDMMDELVYRRRGYAGSKYTECIWNTLPVNVQRAIINDMQSTLHDLGMDRKPVAPPPRKPDQPITTPEGGAW